MLFEPFVHRSITFLCRLSPWFKGDFLFSTLAARLSFRTCIENFEFLQIEQSKLSKLISLFRTVRNFAKKQISVSRNVMLIWIWLNINNFLETKSLKQVSCEILEKSDEKNSRPNLADTLLLYSTWKLAQQSQRLPQWLVADLCN